MSGSRAERATSLLPPGYRAAGLLLHVTSLPGPFGIGDLGPEAFRWIDIIAEAGQSWWQMLPLGPTGQGNSPYDPFSTFAGNLLLLSPERMLEDKLLDAADVGHLDFPAERVNYDAVRDFKSRLLAIAWDRFRGLPAGPLHDAFDSFRSKYAHWLDDFALFLAIKQRMHGAFFYHWPAPLARRDPEAMTRMATELSEGIEFVKFGQFLFFHQWEQLRRHAHERGVRLLGDMPFFVSHDSSEVWAHPELFLLKPDRHPVVVAGVPPDYFSITGQLWGNPVYDWDRLRETGYRWWIRRLTALLGLVDGVRLDHFRAFSAAWHIPAGAPTAESGKWEAGPGADFIATAQESLGGLPFIAEDLGLITEDVRQLRDDFGLPGMQILQFAFDDDPENLFLPQYYTANSVAFTGTHDNDTTKGWFQNLHEDGLRAVVDYFGDDVNDENITPRMLNAVWASKSALAIAPLQDLLNLDSRSRMNIPGLATGNWAWRFTRDQLTESHIHDLATLTAEQGRWRATP